MPHNPVHFAGDRRTIGLQQGVRIRGLRLPALGPDDRAFGAACRAAVERHHPAILPEFDGLCEASGLPADRFAGYYFGRTAPLAGGCTNIAVTGDRSATGSTLAGGNYDWVYADRRWREARIVAPAGEPTRIGYTHHWTALCDAVNDRGLAIAIASLPSADVQRPGIQWHIAVDLVLTACADAVAATDLLSRIPHVRSLSYLVADARTARLVETSPAGVDVHEPRDGIVVGTNARIAADHAARAGGTSAARGLRARALLESGKDLVDRTRLVHALSDHEGGICAGDHGRFADIPGGQSGTIWSFVVAPAERELSVAPGHPCVTPYDVVRWEG